MNSNSTLGKGIPLELFSKKGNPLGKTGINHYSKDKKKTVQKYKNNNPNESKNYEFDKERIDEYRLKMGALMIEEFIKIDQKKNKGHSGGEKKSYIEHKDVLCRFNKFGTCNDKKCHYKHQQCPNIDEETGKCKDYDECKLGHIYKKN
jgi:hypothetical protein